MSRLTHIVALSTVALLLTGGAALACCHSGPVACCGEDSQTISEHCSNGQTISMDCAADHAFIATTTAMNAKTLDPTLVTRVLTQFGPSMPPTGERAGLLPASIEAGNAEFSARFVALRL